MVRFETETCCWSQSHNCQCLEHVARSRKKLQATYRPKTKKEEANSIHEENSPGERGDFWCGHCVMRRQWARDLTAHMKTWHPNESCPPTGFHLDIREAVFPDNDEIQAWVLHRIKEYEASLATAGQDAKVPLPGYNNPHWPAGAIPPIMQNTHMRKGRLCTRKEGGVYRTKKANKHKDSDDEDGDDDAEGEDDNEGWEDAEGEDEGEDYIVGLGFPVAQTPADASYMVCG